MNNGAAFDIAADGSLSNRRVWADVTGDGICIDAEGAVWCSAVGSTRKASRSVGIRIRANAILCPPE
jgi:sugar lactone lactonase YvrE